MVKNTSTTIELDWNACDLHTIMNKLIWCCCFFFSQSCRNKNWRI